MANAPDGYVSRLLPDSISFDEKFQAAATGTDEQLTAVHALIPNLPIYPILGGSGGDYLPQPSETSSSLPQSVIEHLAVHFHVDGFDYFTDEPERQRWLVRQFHEMHRYKGTVYAFRWFCTHILRRDLLRYAPPSKSYAGKSLTDEERAAWEQPHPEIRISPYVHEGSKQSAFAGDCLYKAFPYKTDALLRIGDLVQLYDPLTDATTDLNTLELESGWETRTAAQTVEIRKPGQRAGLFCGAVLQGYSVDHEADQRLYRIALTKTYETEVERRIPLSVQPSLQAMDGRYRWQALPGAVGFGAYPANRWAGEPWPGRGGSGCHLGAGSFPLNNKAGARLRKVFKLFDPDRVTAQTRNARLFAGAFRLGPCNAHHGELAVDMQGLRIAKAQYASGFPGNYPIKSDAVARVALAAEVLRLAKRVSDKISLQITNRRPVRAVSTLTTGTSVAGQQLLEVIS